MYDKKGEFWVVLFHQIVCSTVLGMTLIFLSLRCVFLYKLSKLMLFFLRCLFLIIASWSQNLSESCETGCVSGLILVLISEKDRTCGWCKGGGGLWVFICELVCMHLCVSVYSPFSVHVHVYAYQCVFECLCGCLCVYLFVCALMCKCLSVCMSLCVCKYVCVCPCVSTCVCVSVFKGKMWVWVFVHLPIWVCLCLLFICM